MSFFLCSLLLLVFFVLLLPVEPFIPAFCLRHSHCCNFLQADDNNDEDNNNEVVDGADMEALAQLSSQLSSLEPDLLLGSEQKASRQTFLTGRGVSPLDEPGFKTVSDEFLNGILLRENADNGEFPPSPSPPSLRGKVTNETVASLYGNLRSDRFENDRLQKVAELEHLLDEFISEKTDDIGKRVRKRVCSACGV